MKKLADKVVWITGASSGIGEALAYAFAEHGASLILTARRTEELERVRANCEATVLIELLPMDLEKTEDLSQKVEWMIAKMGSIDILIN